jgi:hypothetical protein
MLKYTVLLAPIQILIKEIVYNIVRVHADYQHGFSLTRAHAGESAAKIGAATEMLRKMVYIVVMELIEKSVIFRNVRRLPCPQRVGSRPIFALCTHRKLY